MPRTASTRTSNRTYRRTRQAPAEAQVPILFRFPNLEMRSGTPDSNVDDSISTVIDPKTDAPEVTSPVAIPSAEPKVSAASKQKLQPVAPAPQNLEQNLPITDTSTGGWWDHWSSGIVLLLLVIALITASVVALNDTGATDPELLAEAETKSANDDPLSIPSLAEIDAASQDYASAAPEFPVIQPGENNSAAIRPPQTELPAAPLLNDIFVDKEGDRDEPTTSGEVGLPLTLDAIVASDNESSVVDTTETPSSDSGVSSPLLLLDAELTSASPQASESATASLHLPTESPNAPLFPESNGSPVLKPSVAQSTTGEQDSQVAAPGQGTGSGQELGSGQSPSLYDGAQSATASAINTGSRSTGNTQLPTGPIPDRQTMRIPAQLASGALSTKPSIPGQPSASPAQQPVTTPQPIKTQTPDMDADKIIRTYQQMMLDHESAISTGNRYNTP